MLTAKQEKFVRNLIQGMTQREAYKNSYDAENMSDKVIDNEASILFNSHEIAMRYKELQDRLANATIMTAQERLEYLTGIVLGTEQEQGYSAEGEEIERPATLRERMQAIDLMNKMQGEYTTNTKVTVSYEDRLREVVDKDEY